jgi:hypothetical protein
VLNQIQKQRVAQLFCRVVITITPSQATAHSHHCKHFHVTFCRFQAAVAAAVQHRADIMQLAVVQVVSNTHQLNRFHQLKQLSSELAELAA